MTLTLKSDEMNISKWWVDSYFAVHKKIKSQTGWNIEPSEKAQLD